MTSIESILNKGSTYMRFRIAVRVMQEVLAAAPEPVSTEALERFADCPARTLVRVCANLAKAGMLTPADKDKRAWIPGSAAAGATLADVLCSEIAYRDRRQEIASRVRESMTERRHDMDAFLLQATMKINQTVIEQLRRFPLRKSGGCSTVAVRGT